MLDLIAGVALIVAFATGGVVEFRNYRNRDTDGGNS